jgi:hypothetical protein
LFQLKNIPKKVNFVVEKTPKIKSRSVIEWANGFGLGEGGELYAQIFNLSSVAWR